MTRSTAARLLLAGGLTALLVGCGGAGTTDEPTPGTPGEITENAGYQVPELTDPPSPGG